MMSLRQFGPEHVSKASISACPSISSSTLTSVIYGLLVAFCTKFILNIIAHKLAQNENDGILYLQMFLPHLLEDHSPLATQILLRQSKYWASPWCLKGAAARICSCLRLRMRTSASVLLTCSTHMDKARAHMSQDRDGSPLLHFLLFSLHLVEGMDDSYLSSPFICAQCFVQMWHQGMCSNIS